MQSNCFTLIFDMPLKRQLNSVLNINLYINISTGPLISSLHFFLHTKQTLILVRDSTDDSYVGSVFSTVMTFNTTKYDILHNKQCSILWNWILFLTLATSVNGTYQYYVTCLHWQFDRSDLKCLVSAKNRLIWK